MLIIFIGAGEGPVRRFATMRRHCSLYEPSRKVRWKSKDCKSIFLSLPPRSFVALDFGGSRKEIDPEDGGELSSLDMRNLMSKASRIAVMTHMATERDFELAAAIMGQ